MDRASRRDEIEERRRQGERTPANSSGLATQPATSLTSRAGRKSWISVRARRYVRTCEATAESERDGKSPSPARRGKFSGKISGKLQAGRREQPTRARPRPTRASFHLPPSPPLPLSPTIKRHQHRPRSRLLRCRNRVLSSGFSDAISDTRSITGSAGSRDVISRGGSETAEGEMREMGKMEVVSEERWQIVMSMCRSGRGVLISHHQAAQHPDASHARPMSVVGHAILPLVKNLCRASRVQRGRIYWWRWLE